MFFIESYAIIKGFCISEANKPKEKKLFHFDVEKVKIQSHIIERDFSQVGVHTWKLKIKELTT